MKIILREDVDKLGRAGDVKDVKRGYARNFLYTRGLAVAATPSALAWVEKGKERREKALEKALGEAKAACEKLSEVRLEFSRRIGEGGKLFGSVGKSDIVKSLKASGFSVPNNAVLLESALKQVGESEVTIRLAPDATAQVKVIIVPRS